jgi:hypothetical protein
MVRNQKPKGQSAVEFLLAAPLLFLFFFMIIQSAYLGLTALALQRAAMAGAREIGLTGIQNDQNIRLKIAVSLAPLAYLSQAAFIGILNCRYESNAAFHPREIRFSLHYPMPIWVPIAGKLLGGPLPAAPPGFGNGMTPSLREVFKTAGITRLNLRDTHRGLPCVRWLTFEATFHNEGFPGESGIKP